MKDKRKRKVLKPPTLETDIYVSKKTVAVAQIKRINQLFDQGKPVVVIHGLGIAIVTAIQIALRFKQEHPTVQWTIETSTVQLVDDIEPMDMDQEPHSQTRSNSAIHIHIQKP